MTGRDGLARLVETVLSQALGAARHERTKDRTCYRNGYRSRTLYTRAGPVSLQVPQTRDGSFSTGIFQRYQRGEQAAEQATRHLARFAVVVIDPQLVFKGIVRSRVSRLSFWDSLILESAMEGKAEVLYTEDMQHGQEVEGIRIVNPFVSA
jgi:hypothetical protein